MRRRVEIEIEELVLHGFDRRDRHAIGEAIEREITLLLQREGGEGFAASSRLDAARFAVTSRMTPDAIGREAARSIVQALQPMTTRADRPAMRSAGAADTPPTVRRNTP